MALAIFGILNIYSSSFSASHPAIFDISKEYGKQIMFFGVSLVMGFVILLLEGDFIKKSSYISYAFVVFLLALVLVAGREVNGAKSWFGVGGFGIQPSELAKIGVSMGVARYLSSVDIRFNIAQIIVILGALIGLPAVLILLQPDAGTMLVFTAFILVGFREGLVGEILLYGIMFAFTGITTLILKGASFFSIDYTFSLMGANFTSANMFFMLVIVSISGFIIWVAQNYLSPRSRRKAILKTSIIGIICLIIIPSTLIAFNKLPDRHQNRIEITLGQKEDPRGVGYNIHQALSAIGSGEFSGKGYRNATLANDEFNHVPEQGTDFIFCTLAEEWGFLGGFVLFGLFVTLITRIYFIAERQRSNYARIFAYSVASILFLHFTINIGMVIGLVPVIGIPLPFFSYGGSSLLAFSILIFTVLKLDSERMDVLR